MDILIVEFQSLVLYAFKTVKFFSKHCFSYSPQILVDTVFIIIQV